MVVADLQARLAASTKELEEAKAQLEALQRDKKVHTLHIYLCMYICTCRVIIILILLVFNFIIMSLLYN